MGSILEFLRKPIPTCDLPGVRGGGESGPPVTPSGSAHVLHKICHTIVKVVNKKLISYR